MARIFQFNRCKCGRIKGLRWFLFMYVRGPVHMGCKGCYDDAQTLVKQIEDFLEDVKDG